ncbi:hypothetical protein PR202_ga11043 [Eleusine coracana subsp. coracana]|uniref:Alpha/beta hydrolase fold-3 domain-containing protein n=1 Tax=Eleusine coracana subsp. coracana TaxID=191504 RepID=A0AAV5C8C1_ELECO|nr:hypothetical protein PR202_ga11043 [Eleusine coracana subsp. coracana]
MEAAAGAEIANDLSPFLRTYKDGRVERLVSNNFVPASEAPGANGIATRDVVIDPATGVSARLFLSVAAAATGKKHPIIVYNHGGGFCTGSAFSKLFHRYASSLSARAGALVVSVDYRLAPEHPIPAAFDDGWAALRWVTTFADPWLAFHGDHTRTFLAGESAGAVIAHNVLARAATPEGDDIDIEGMVLLHPFFWSHQRLPLEIDDGQKEGPKPLFVPEKLDNFFSFLLGSTEDHPCAYPPVEVVASLPCRRALVAVAARDLARHRGRRYAERLQRHGKLCREVTFLESEGEDHAFHLYRTTRPSAVALMDSVVKFIDGGERTPPLPNKKPVVERGLLHDPAMNLSVGAYDKVCWDNLVANGSSAGNNQIRITPRPMVRNALVVRPGKSASSVLSFGGLVKNGPMKIF